MTSKAQTKVDMTNKKVDDNIVSKIAQTSIAVCKKSANAPNHSEINATLNDSITDFEDGEFLPDKDINENAAINVVSPEIGIVQKIGDPTKLPLHNSFELLEVDFEHVTGEAMQADKGFTLIAIDKDMSDINKNVEEIPLEKENLTHITNLEDPCDWKIGILILMST